MSLGTETFVTVKDGTLEISPTYETDIRKTYAVTFAMTDLNKYPESYSDVLYI